MAVLRFLDGLVFLFLVVATVILMMSGDMTHALMCGIWAESCAIGRILYRIEKAKGSG